MTTPIVTRLVGGPADGRLHPTVANIFGTPPAAIVATAPDGMLGAAPAADDRLRGMDVPHTAVPVIRSNYFYVGTTDAAGNHIYVHTGMDSWWGAPNEAEVPPEPYTAPGGWQWVRYIGGQLDGVLDRLPVCFTRWHAWRTTRVRDQHGAMLFLWTELGIWG